jgi:Ser/Thr protein kinase RdoA (MazF antagonist)
MPADLIRAIEAQYDLRVTAPPQKLPQGVHSQAWLVTTTDGNWVAKLSHPLSDPLPKLERQIRISTYLNQRGIRAPRMLPLRNGGLIATLLAGQQAYLMQLMRHEALSRIRAGHASEATLAAVGALVARLHTVLEQYPERHTFVADRLKSANEWGAQDQGFWAELHDRAMLALIPPERQDWLRTIDQRACAYIRQCYPDPAGLAMAILHGDLNFEHIRFFADQMPYVFDFGDMCWGPIAHELAVLFLNTFCDSEMSFAAWELLQQRFLKGYSARRPISQHDRAMISVFIVNRVVGRARYGLELAHDTRITFDWPGTERTYRLAEYLLNQREREER